MNPENWPPYPIEITAIAVGHDEFDGEDLYPYWIFYRPKVDPATSAPMTDNTADTDL